ncbi:MAG: starch-binding protein [Oscillospiraceae bacterium]|nr:starch-binding protein [Oscillospiraceae bacterium]
MNTRISKLLSVLLVVALLSTLLCAIPVSAEPAAPTIQEGVTLHCWNWSFKEIEARLDIIASLGYTAIQTSPIQQAKQPTFEYPTNDWWVYYQPAAFVIDDTGTSALGNKADFQSLCAAAEQKGIKVIVDVVANHMGNTSTGTNGLADTIIPDLKNDPDCWHDIKKNTGNYNDRTEVTQYCMAGLPDLNTANPKVQTYVLNFLKECVDAGADGFRFDAIKHIETPEDGALSSDFWPNVIGGLKDYAPDVYCYGELLDNPGGGLSYTAYTKYMSVTDNTWSAGLLGGVSGGNASALTPSFHKGDASKLVLWAESHDTFADGSTDKISEEKINKTWALIAARKDAMGLYLARPANISQFLGTASIGGWAAPEVAAANRFHNAFAGQSEYVANENGIAYVERGTNGVVLVNCKGAEADISVTANTMADGTYTDAISGNTFTVSGGKIAGKIGASGIAVVYEAQACAHDAHDAEGFCNACRAQVGHSYDSAGKCACGDVQIPERTIYFINTGKWKTVNFYSWYEGSDIISSAWPGDAMTKVEGDIYACTVPADAPNIIFNDGSTQTDDLSVPAVDTGKDLYDFATGKWSTYGEEEPTQPTEPETQPTEPETQPVETTQPTEATQPAPAEPKSNNTILIVGIVLGVIAVAAVAVVLFKKKNG